MLLQTVHREISSAGLQSVHKATIAQTAKSFELFSDKIYSDKILAVVRELTSNALDAHQAAGNTDPVHVFLPDDLDPYFRVKDQGIGMSYDFCKTQFMRYSDGSTKDGSNDSIGGFGLGSKSPFSYTDQFILTSVHDGEKSVYSVFKDEDGVPCIGLLAQQPTNEINGVEFAVPVEPEDFGKFTTAALKGLQYFTNVKLHGAELIPPDYIQQGASWGVRRDPGKAQVIMGGVAYPVVQHQLGYDLGYDARLSPLLEMPLDMIVPIGACLPTISRESLEYKDVTKNSIRTALESIIDEIVADIPTMFDHLDSRWEAICQLYEYLGGNTNSARSRLVLQHVRYRGEELTLHLKPDFAAYEKRWDIGSREGSRRSSYRTSNCPSPGWDHGGSVTPAKIATVIVDDLPPTSKSATIKRIKTYVDDTIPATDCVLVIRPLDHTDIKPALEAFGNPPEYILTSSLPEPQRAIREAGQKNARPYVRMFQLDYKAKTERTRSVTPTKYQSPLHEISYEYQPGVGVRVTMDNFTLPEDFWPKYFLFKDDELYLVNKSDAVKLKNFVDFHEEAERRLAVHLADNPTIQQSLALWRSDLAPLIRFINNNKELFKDTPKTKPLARLIGLIEDYVVDRDHKIEALIVPELPPRLDPEALLKSIEAKHANFMTAYGLVKDSAHYAPNSPIFNLLKDLI